MARLTVEDCLRNVDNIYDLVLLSAKRTRQIIEGKQELVPNPNKDRATVIALREIADRCITHQNIDGEDSLSEDKDDINTF